MGIETERRFIVVTPQPENAATRTIHQRYLPDTGGWTIRLRRSEGVGGTRHVMTMKRPLSHGSAEEHETPVTKAFHDDLAGSCGPALVKRRTVIRHGGRDWEVDTYQNPELEGLMIAEVEIGSMDDDIEIPEWVGQEVTGDAMLSNAALATRLQP